MYNQNIHALVSDLDLEKWLIDNLKDRRMFQKYLYLWDSALDYYRAYSDWQIDPDAVSHFDFIGKHMRKDKKLAVISLWCGDASQEKELLMELKEKWFNFTYFGVDISRKMLNLAINNLSEIDIDKRFILADTMSEHFRQEISGMTRDYDSRFFCFLWRTFCNTNQTNSTDSFYNLLSKEDYLWFDVYTRDNDDTQTNLKIFNRYNEYILDSKNSKKINFQFSVLKHLWVKESDGKFILEMKKEPSIGTLVFSFSYLFSKKVVVSFRNEKVHILPWESVELYDIRNYYIPKLLDFFKQHDFKKVDHSSKPYLWDRLKHSQFLFRK